MEKPLREIARRLEISLDQARSLPPLEIRSLLANPSEAAARADQVFAQHVFLNDELGAVTGLFDEVAAELIQHFQSPVATPGESVQQLKGNCACRGTARGVVKIINRVEDLPKMERGDILVSRATSPSLVPAMKKAAAILTDEGGLTCHAAIVSRELNIPCVVGLKTVTQAFQDGDLLEVDATKGLVRRISNEF